MADKVTPKDRAALLGNTVARISFRENNLASIQLTQIDEESGIAHGARLVIDAQGCFDAMRLFNEIALDLSGDPARQAAHRAQAAADAERARDRNKTLRPERKARAAARAAGIGDID